MNATLGMTSLAAAYMGDFLFADAASLGIGFVTITTSAFAVRGLRDAWERRQRGDVHAAYLAARRSALGVA